MNEDPVIYRVQAVVNLVVWLSFVVTYGLSLRRAKQRGRGWPSPFAWAILEVGVAVALYSVATFLRQFLGADYPFRDVVRICASAGLTIAGLTISVALLRYDRRRR